MTEMMTITVSLEDLFDVLDNIAPRERVMWSKHDRQAYNRLSAQVRGVDRGDESVTDDAD